MFQNVCGCSRCVLWGSRGGTAWLMMEQMQIGQCKNGCRPLGSSKSSQPNLLPVLRRG